jgi:hypothetical protein
MSSRWMQLALTVRDAEVDAALYPESAAVEVYREALAALRSAAEEKLLALPAVEVEEKVAGVFCQGPLGGRA